MRNDLSNICLSRVSFVSGILGVDNSLLHCSASNTIFYLHRRLMHSATMRNHCKQVKIVCMVL